MHMHKLLVESMRIVSHFEIVSRNVCMHVSGTKGIQSPRLLQALMCNSVHVVEINDFIQEFLE